MKTILRIVTREYPYGNAENFLESEIPILARHFENIVIYPSRRHEDIRSLPLNVVIDDKLCKIYQNRFGWLLNLLTSKILLKAFFQYRSKLGNTNVLSAILKYCASYTIYKQFAKSIFKEDEESLVYSYWYSSAVDALTDHKTDESKVVCRVHRGDLYEEFSSIGFFPFREEKISNVDCIYSISSDGEKYLKERYQIQNVRVSRLGVRDYGILNVPSSSGHFNIVSVSNIIKVKRVDLIAQSVISMAKRNPNVSIEWNHFGDGGELTRVKEIISENNMPNLTCIFHGRLPNKKIYEYYSKYSVDAFINLSESEGIPVSIMEAISFGIPVLATEVGGVAEVVNECNGALVQTNTSAEEISKQLALLMNVPKSREMIKENWKNNYSSENNYTEFAKDLLTY